MRTDTNTAVREENPVVLEGRATYRLNGVRGVLLQEATDGCCRKQQHIGATIEPAPRRQSPPPARSTERDEAASVNFA